MDARRGERSVTDVLADVFRNVQDLLRSEIRLAQSEVRDDMARVRPAAILLAAGIGTALLSTLFVLLSIFHALQQVMPAWAAALCLAIALGLTCAIFVAAGLKRFRALSMVRRTRAQVEETVECVKEQIR
jgi:hypothetical protein